MIKKLLFLLFFLPALLYAQDNPFKNKIYSISDFSGGLNTKISPYSLPSKQGDICENLRFNIKLGSISKRDQILTYGTADASEPITGMHRLYLNNGTKVLIAVHGDEIETGVDTTGVFTPILALTTGNYRWQWLTWNNVAIGTDGYNQPVKYDGTSASATYLGTCLATVSATVGNPSGTYTYKVSFYTTSYEVIFNVASNSVSPSSKKVSLSMIPIGPDTYGGESVTGRKVYRVEAGVWKLLSNGTIADNSTTTLLDNDTTASGAAYPTVNGTTVFSATPPKGKLCLIHYNRLFLANDPSTPAPSRLYYSDDGNKDYFISTDYYWDIRPDDGDQITFIKHQKGLLTIGKENSIQKFFTDGATPSSDWEVSDPFSNIGCKAMYSAQETPLGIFYLGSDGIYKFDGQNSQLISEVVTPEINDILESNLGYCWGQYYKSQYLLAYPSKKTSVSTNNRILIFDLLANAYEIDTFSANCFTTFNSGTDWDILYSGSSTDGKVYSHKSQINEIRHNKHSDFAGTFTNARYIPTTVGGDANNPEIEIARTETINSLAGIINDLTGTIDRGSLTGSYISQALNTGALAAVGGYDKIYWNERLLSSGDDVTFAIRSASTEAGLAGAAWSAEYSDPTGSDISALTAGVWMQYRISLTTDAYAHSPTVYNVGNFTVKLTYFKEASTSETSIPFRWRSGWLNLDVPGYRKTLRKFTSLHSGSSGTLTYVFTMLDFNNTTNKFEEVTDTFSINLAEYPYYYADYFTGGGLSGELLRVNITNSDLYSLSIDKILLSVDGEPLI
jgi:hypothetical protein